MVIAKKEVEYISILIQFFSYLRKKGDFEYPMKYMMKNIMEFPCLVMSNSALYSVQNEDI